MGHVSSADSGVTFGSSPAGVRALVAAGTCKGSPKAVRVSVLVRSPHNVSESRAAPLQGPSSKVPDGGHRYPATDTAVTKVQWHGIGHEATDQKQK